LNIFRSLQRCLDKKIILLFEETWTILSQSNLKKKSLKKRSNSLKNLHFIRDLVMIKKLENENEKKSFTFRFFFMEKIILFNFFKWYKTNYLQKMFFLKKSFNFSKEYLKLLFLIPVFFYLKNVSIRLFSDTSINFFW